MEKYDLLIIGGGAAGIMAAITAAKNNPQYRVALVDRTFALGRKILVCGAGRCNITNINLGESTKNHYYGSNPEFIDSVFKNFSYQQIVDFFKELGVEFYTERKTSIGKVFPVTNQAQTITTLLEDELARVGVKVFLNTEVKSVEKNDRFEVAAIQNSPESHKQIRFVSKYLIIAAGGKTYPALGSNGSGFSLAESLGHKIIEPVPSALPLESKNQLSHLLQGVRLDAEVTSLINKVSVKTRTDELMFTKYGFSGPVILNVSREISIRINRDKKTDCALKFNFFPGKSEAEVRQLLDQRWQLRPSQKLINSLVGLFSTKVPAAILQVAGFEKDIAVNQLDQIQKDKLVGVLTSFEATVNATRGWNEAEFTAGGVDTKEVKKGTLESKRIPGLYFCGEILDVDGDVGGFNLSWAWSSGFTAGCLR